MCALQAGGREGAVQRLRAPRRPASSPGWGTCSPPAPWWLAARPSSWTWPAPSRRSPRTPSRRRGGAACSNRARCDVHCIVYWAGRRTWGTWCAAVSAPGYRRSPLWWGTWSCWLLQTAQTPAASPGRRRPLLSAPLRWTDIFRATCLECEVVWCRMERALS